MVVSLGHGHSLASLVLEFFRRRERSRCLSRRQRRASSLCFSGPAWRAGMLARPSRAAAPPPVPPPERPPAAPPRGAAADARPGDGASATGAVAGRSAVAGPGPPRRCGRSSSCRVPPPTAPAFQRRSQRRVLDPRRAPSPFPVTVVGRALAPPPPPTASMRSPPPVAPAFRCRSQRRAVEPRPAPKPFPVPLFGSAVTLSPPPTASMRSQGDGGGRALSQVDHNHNAMTLSPSMRHSSPATCLALRYR